MPSHNGMRPPALPRLCVGRMMATAAPASGSSLLPLLESLEDSTAGQPEQTDVYLTIAR